MNSDLELERASWWPTDQMCRLIGEEDMRNKPERQADDANVKHQSIEKQQVQNAAMGLRLPAEAEMYQWENHAQEKDNQAEHFETLPGSGRFEKARSAADAAALNSTT